MTAIRKYTSKTGKAINDLSRERDKLQKERDNFECQLAEISRQVDKTTTDLLKKLAEIRNADEDDPYSDYKDSEIHEMRRKK